MTAKFIRKYTLCNVDCSEFGHHQGHKICDRCGAHIHKTIFEVEFDGVIMTVGAECYKDVMGYNFTQSHQKAMDVVESITAAIPAHCDAVYAEILKSRVQFFRYKDDGKVLKGSYGCVGSTDTPHNISATVARAGEDLGLWRVSGNGKGLHIKKATA